MSLKEQAIARADMLTLPVHLFHTDPAFNVRIACDDLTAHIHELADGIKNNGFRRDKPLLVRMVEDRAIVVDGHCRLAAVQLAINEGAEIKGIPCIIEPKGTNDADRTLALLTANAGRALQPLEEAAAVMRLISFGWSEADIARKRGKSKQWVCNLLTLNSAPEPIRQAVINGEVSATQATKMTRESPKQAVETLNKVRETSPGRKVTAAAIAQTKPREMSPRQQAINDLMDVWDQINPRDIPVSLQGAIEDLRPYATR